MSESNDNQIEPQGGSVKENSSTDAVVKSQEKNPGIFPAAYTGEGGAMAGLYLKNIFLSILTLGIYSFWGRVETTKYLLSHTSFENGSFNYHATGKERFMGFLKALVIIVPLFILAGLAGPFAGLIILLAFIFLQPLLIVGKLRFQHSRSSWSNIRFRFSGTIGDCYALYIKGIVLSIITLGIYVPWFINSLQSFIVTNSYIGKKQFEYDGESKELFILYLKGFIFSILTFGIYQFKFASNIQKFLLKSITLKNLRFKTTLSGTQVFVLYLQINLIVLFTLGLGVGFAVHVAMQTYINAISAEGDPSVLRDIEGDEDLGASAISDGVADAADALEAVSGAF